MMQFRGIGVAKHRVSRVPVFETRFRVWDQKLLVFESSPRPRLRQLWISRPISRPRRVPNRESRCFESESPFCTTKKGFFLLKSFNFSPSPLDFDSESETSLRYLQKSRPIPRLRRVLNRETRCFESDTRDSGNFATDPVLTILTDETI